MTLSIARRGTVITHVTLGLAKMSSKARSRLSGSYPPDTPCFAILPYSKQRPYQFLLLASLRRYYECRILLLAIIVVSHTSGWARRNESWSIAKLSNWEPSTASGRSFLLGRRQEITKLQNHTCRVIKSGLIHIVIQMDSCRNCSLETVQGGVSINLNFRYNGVYSREKLGYGSGLTCFNPQEPSM